MLYRWKKRIKNLFNSEEEETEKNHPSNQSIQTKVTFQYPERSHFPINDQELEKPAYLRREQNYQTHRYQTPHENEGTKDHHNKQAFKPTQVASPIYGYQKRKRKNKIENIPAYVRKEKQQSNFDNDFKKENPKDIKEQLRTFKELPELNSKEAKGKNTYKNKQEKTNQVIQKTTTKHNKSSAYKQKKQTKAVPFNVIMTPRDKKKLRDRDNILNKKSQQANSINEADQYSIPFHLLNQAKRLNDKDALWIQTQQEILEKTLRNFHVKAKVVNSTQGPTVTRFEVQPELGVKVSRIRNLSDDIKLNMAAKDIRMEAPIPGKHTIGIEIPNQQRQTVSLQQILRTKLFKRESSPLTIGLGLDVEGEPFITNISEMPHGLIAGATGSGKSVCINAILISILYKASHEDVKLLLIDPKMVELAHYNGIPHLLSPVITDVKAATAALKWAVNEMEERYEKFVQEGVRSIEGYNDKMVQEKRNDEKMPFIVIVIDELADLMMVSPQDVEDAISRIAQKARACGMHLLLATQRPSVDVITGLIKANIPTRISFSVSSQVDSRTIIDMNGAERLLGKGDMLLIENGTGKTKRLQCAFVSDEEIDRVTNFVRNISTPTYLFEQEQLIKKMEKNEDRDEIFEEVIEFVVEQTNISTSLLQRHFRIGYNRAARLIDTLESKGIISGQNGSKPRDVLVTKTELEQIEIL